MKKIAPPKRELLTLFLASSSLFEFSQYNFNITRIEKY